MYFKVTYVENEFLFLLQFQFIFAFNDSSIPGAVCITVQTWYSVYTVYSHHNTYLTFTSSAQWSSHITLHHQVGLYLYCEIPYEVLQVDIPMIDTDVYSITMIGF